MQKIIFHHPDDTPPANKWFHSRRHYHVRRLYRLFFKAYTTFTQQYHNFSQNRTEQPATRNKETLRLLKELSHLLFSSNHFEQYGQHLNWVIHALYHATSKQQENINMAAFHYQAMAQDPESRDIGHTTYIDQTDIETENQFNTLKMLFDNARDLLRLLLVDQTGNDLLLRLLIEEESIGKILWETTTLELFSEMFPYQPEAGYIQAGKSYFMGQWLEEALCAYEKSLTINNTLSEPRRQTYLIRAMIQDRDHYHNAV